MTADQPEKPDDEPEFSLKRESTDSGRRRPRIIETGTTTQKVLFPGADCLAGQQDLFE